MVAPANDNWANAEVVTLDGAGTYQSAPVDATDATDETGQPNTFSSTRWVWWKFTPTADDTISLDTELTTGNFPDTSLGVYTGSAVNALTLVAPNDDSPTSGNTLSRIDNLPVTAGVTYSIGVGSWGDPPQYVLRVAGTPTTVIPVESDTTYANDGYSYDGTAEVDYEPPVAPTPARVRRATVMRVHQSLPAPTLVDGRPT